MKTPRQPSTWEWHTSPPACGPAARDARTSVADLVRAAEIDAHMAAASVNTPQHLKSSLLGPAQQRTHRFVFSSLHAPAPTCTLSDLQAAVMGDASVVHAVEALGSVAAPPHPLLGAAAPPPPMPLGQDLLQALGDSAGEASPPSLPRGVSAAATAYVDAVRKYRALAEDLPAPRDTLSRAQRQHLDWRRDQARKRRGSTLAVSGAAAVQGGSLSSSATLESAVNVAAGRWDAFTSMVAQSFDLVRSLELFVAKMAVVRVAELEEGQPEEIMVAAPPLSLLAALGPRQGEGGASATPPQHRTRSSAGDSAVFRTPDSEDEGAEPVGPPPALPGDAVRPTQVHLTTPGADTPCTPTPLDVDTTPPGDRVRALVLRLQRGLRQSPAWRASVAEEGQGAPGAGARHTPGHALSGALAGQGALTWQEVDDALERLVMSKLHHLVGRPAHFPGAALWDDVLTVRCLALAPLVSWAQLDVPPPAIQAPLPWGLAIAWLRAMSRFCAPTDKMTCLLNASSVISRLLSHEVQADTACMVVRQGAQVGADDFLPALIWCLLRAACPTLYTDLRYINTYRDPTQLMSEQGYYFTNLVSACNFIVSASPAQLHVDAAELDATTAASVRRVLALREEAGAGGTSGSTEVGTGAATAAPHDPTPCVQPPPLHRQGVLSDAALRHTARALATEDTLEQLLDLHQQCCSALVDTVPSQEALAWVGLGGAQGTPPLPLDLAKLTEGEGDEAAILEALLMGEEEEEEEEGGGAGTAQAQGAPPPSAEDLRLGALRVAQAVTMTEEGASASQRALAARRHSITQLTMQDGMQTGVDIPPDLLMLHSLCVDVAVAAKHVPPAAP